MDQPSWNNSPWFNHNTWGFFFDETGKYTGSDVFQETSLPRFGAAYESLFNDDLNNDGLITPGASPTTCLTSAATNITSMMDMAAIA